MASHLLWFRIVAQMVFFEYMAEAISRAVAERRLGKRNWQQLFSNLPECTARFGLVCILLYLILVYWTGGVSMSLCPTRPFWFKSTESPQHRGWTVRHRWRVIIFINTVRFCDPLHDSHGSARRILHGILASSLVGWTASEKRLAFL